MTKIYLSPHLDDAVFSCGGIIFEETSKGEKVEVWTYATADPLMNELTPFARLLHERWGNPAHPVRVRRKEDEKALASLNCAWQHLGFLDCIYRRDELTNEPLIRLDDDLFSPLEGREKTLIDRMTLATHSLLAHQLPGEMEIYSPLAVGGHIDHQITRAVAEQLGMPLFYYADFPYAAKTPTTVDNYLPQGVLEIQEEISSHGLAAWQKAIACYKSQISSFWHSSDDMKQVVENYAGYPAARTRWKKP